MAGLRSRVHSPRSNAVHSAGRVVESDAAAGAQQESKHPGSCRPSGTPSKKFTQLKTQPVLPRIPLSDHRVDLNTINVVLSSAQSREKCLKIVQYVFKLAAYLLLHFAGMFALASRLQTWSKSVSQARRYFKFIRWMKHFQDIGAANEDFNRWFRKVLWFDILCNLAADICEDICSLERLGFLQAGTLPSETEYWANFCQLVLALVEIFVAIVRRRRLHKMYALDPSVALGRRLTMANLELSKFVADVGKAFWDCELSFASEFLFCVCGLWAALVSTHKFIIKALK